MQRRDFIKLSVHTAMALTLSGVYSPLNAAPTTPPKTIINVMLDGGPDFMHLIVPTYDSNTAIDSYAAKFWQARASIFSVSTADELKDKYNENYDSITLNGVKCGILKKASWLKAQIDAGNVAIVSNAIGSTDRNHHHAKLVMESGDMNASPYNQDVSGWLGRASSSLAHNIVSITSEVRLACNGPHPTDIKRHDNRYVVNNYDSRNIALFTYDMQADIDHNQTGYLYRDDAIMSRALQGYYAAKRGTISESSPYYKAMQHEEKLREFGDQIKAVLVDNVPVDIDNLLNGDDTQKLDSSYFARQIRAAYDTYLTRDILDMRLISMEYTGWDSHKYLRDQIEPKFEDMFGTDKGFDTLISHLNTIDTAIYENMVIVFSGEFGRQHLSNGDHGNDHGRGNSVLIVGGGVKNNGGTNDGLYGDIFPASEKDNLNTKNADIVGKTSMLKIYSTILDWQSSGLGDTVFGPLAGQPVEAGVTLPDIFA